MRVLNVAEKPSAAREIASLLARGQQMDQRAGFSVYNKVFEFQGTMGRQDATFLVTSVSGHLMELDFAGEYRKWGSCPPVRRTPRSAQDRQKVLTPPVHSTRGRLCAMVRQTQRALLLREEAPTVSYVPDRMKQIERTLKREARQCSVLVLWLDCDSEGENIAFEVQSVCKDANPRITVHRARFSAITARDVHQALEQLTALDTAVNDMVVARQELDLRAGAAFTRFLTTRVRSRWPALDVAKVVSYGPCQFPTLALVVDRYLTIQNFVPQNFYVIELTLRAFPGTGVRSGDGSAGTEVKFTWERGRLFDRFIASVLYEVCYEAAVQDSNRARIVAVDRSRRTRWRPLPLATVEMQKQVSRQLRMSSETTMKVAEKLYTSGFISYPRTETEVFATSLNLRELVRQQGSDARWGSFAERLLEPPAADDPVRFQWPRAGRNDDRAHPPIHPTRPAPSGGFESPEMGRLYEYIARRFLACCSVDALGSETVVVAQVGRERFRAKGLIVELRGFLEVYPYDRWTDKALPPMAVGDTPPIAALLLRAGVTEPPPLLSESDLIALMDRHGIGTDATIAQHIQKVLERQYVSKNSAARFQPEPLGLALVQGYERCSVTLARPHVRAEQERGLKQVSAGQVAKEEMLAGALTSFTAMFDRLEANAPALDAAFGELFPEASTQVNLTTTAAGLVRCGRCGGAMDLQEQHVGESAAPRGRRRARAPSRPPVARLLHCARCQLSLGISTAGDVSAAGHTCPLCNFEVVQVHNTERNTRHSLCPQCFNEPPSGDANPQGLASRAFRCFNCSAAGCPLATGVPRGADDVTSCPRCGSPCVLRKSAVFRVSCSQTTCGFVYFFPRGAISVGVTAEQCTRCGSKRLSVGWNRDSLPPGFATSMAACIWCDEAYRGLLQRINEPLPRRDVPDIEDGPRHQPTRRRPRRGAGSSGAAPRRARRARGR